jgi:hypothetical protein
VLLVDDGQPEPLEADILLDEGVGADGYVYGALGDLSLDSGLLL